MTALGGERQRNSSGTAWPERYPNRLGCSRLFGRTQVGVLIAEANRFGATPGDEGSSCGISASASELPSRAALIDINCIRIRHALERSCGCARQIQGFLQLFHSCLQRSFNWLATCFAPFTRSSAAL